MNLYEYFKNSIQLNKIKDLEGDMYELAIVRYVMQTASKLFYRDNTFYLNKENLQDRSSIYDKELDLTNACDFSIVCKTYCTVIDKILKELYSVDSQMISSFSDRFRHVDLLIITKQGHKYIVDPLTDMIEMQTGLRTNNFASKEYYDESYKQKLDNISFFNNTELEIIDDKIGYKHGDLYLDDFLVKLRSDLDNMEEFLTNNEQIATSLLGKKFDGHTLSDDEKTDLKLKYICKYLDNRKYLNGFVDFIMFSNTVIKKMFSESEQSKISMHNFFVDAVDLKNDDFAKTLAGIDDRRRGRVISFNGNNYIVSLSRQSLEYTDKQWNEIVKDNNIFIRPEHPVQLLKYMVSIGADRNIIHNHEFLKLFNKFETASLNNGLSLEDIKNHIIIQDGSIITKFNDKFIQYIIEDNHLVVKDYKSGQKHIVFYEDEGRNIYYKTSQILQDKEKIKLFEFDSNGLFELDDAEGIEDLVSPLKNGRFLSRNKSFYQADTYTNLAKQRKHFRDILTAEPSKRNFVILEYLANSSAKVYFEELKKQVEHKENHVSEAQACFEEDCRNIVRALQNNPLIKPTYDLPESNDSILERHIEMDNKQILYLFCSNMKFDKPKHVITPGLGSIFIGPMLKAMYDFDYTNILFSLYSKDEKLKSIATNNKFEDLLSNDTWYTTPNMLLLLDDNVGSCNTMNTIRKELKERGKSCKFGAIKYNWEFYYKVKTGELDHPSFNPKEVDFLTIIDDAGYWIMRDSIGALKSDGGDAYINVMKSEGLRQDDVPDIQVLSKLAEKYSKMSGVDLYDSESSIIKPSSAYLCKRIRTQIDEISRDAKSCGRSLND